VGGKIKGGGERWEGVWGGGGFVWLERVVGKRGVRCDGRKVILQGRERPDVALNIKKCIDNPLGIGTLDGKCIYQITQKKNTRGGWRNRLSLKKRVGGSRGKKGIA